MGNLNSGQYYVVQFSFVMEGEKHPVQFYYPYLQLRNIFLSYPDDPDNGDYEPDYEDIVFKFGDFDFSRKLELGQWAEDRKGTPLYLPPEVLFETQGKKLMYKSEVDMYAIGVVLYRCTVGDFPFSGVELVTKDMYDEKMGQLPSTFPEGTDEQLKILIRALLLEQPNLRLKADRFCNWRPGLKIETKIETSDDLGNVSFNDNVTPPATYQTTHKSQSSDEKSSSNEVNHHYHGQVNVYNFNQVTKAKRE